jgi:hypothetical protein
MERPINWHCPACNVWGQDMPPAACWACGTKNVEEKFGPPLGEAHRSFAAADEVSDHMPRVSSHRQLNLQEEP